MGIEPGELGLFKILKGRSGIGMAEWADKLAPGEGELLEFYQGRLRAWGGGRLVF